MKKSLFVIALSLSVLGISQAADPVLMKINGVEVKKSEFEYIYGKNNNSSSIEKKSLDEYLVLFKNFKLKVLEAQSKGIDTTKAFISELAGYRKQLAQPYLTDKQADENLALEAYNRLKENVELSHILLRLPEDVSSKDTLATYKKIMAIREQLLSQLPTKKGAAPKLATTCSKEKFMKIAEEVSEDPSKKENKGYLGFISAFNTVYPFELAAYSAKIGQLSMPFRSNYGYHLILVHSRRPDPGQVLAAHIMKSIRPTADSITPEKAEAKAYKAIVEISNRIKKGEDFGKIAEKESDDKSSATKQGELPWFSTGRMIKEFETVAFGLKEKGDISEPFKTRFGWHIVRLNDKKGIEPYETKKAEIVSMLSRDQRAKAGEQAVIARLKKEYSLSENSAALQPLVALAETAFPTDSLFEAKAKGLSNTLFTIGNATFKQNDFVSYLRKLKANSKKSGSDYLKTAYADFVNQSVLQYEERRLDEKYPEFKNLMKEYHDGMLLFEISNSEVWDKASKDNEGLKKFFLANKKNYQFTAPKYKGIVVYCKDEATEKKARRIIKKCGVDSVVYVLKKSLNDSVTRVKVEKGLYAKGENKVVDGQIFKGEKFVPDSQFKNVFVVGKLLEKEPEDFNDVRGLVTSDYQNYLEAEWLKKLNEKYKIEVNNDVLKTVKP